MKRASLKTAKVPLVSSTSLDVTDRILKTDENPRPPAPPKPAPAPKRAPRTTPISPRQPAPPTPAISSSQPDPLVHALAQTGLALTALQNARAVAPAQYDVAIRYRLDALAHHLQQVTDFVTRQAS